MMDAEIPPLFDDLEPLTLEEINSVQPLNTDASNADIFMARYGSAFRYIAEWQSWVAWDGTRWVLVGSEAMAFDASVRSARQSYAESLGRTKLLQVSLRKALTDRGGKCDESDRIEDKIKHEGKVLAWYHQSQNTSRVHACVTAAHTRCQTSMRVLDADPWLFNVANGTINLRTGELQAHDRENLITQFSDIKWDDHAKAPTWDRFVDEAMQGDLELVMYLQRVIGYCMTGVTDEHALFFLHGLGGNGKSTFTRTIHAMMGDYACAAPRHLLFEQKGMSQPHPTEIARLYARRFVTCAEIGERAAFDEAKLKDLTGGDVLSVRRMQEDFWDLHPTHKFLIAGNHKPIIRGDDEGIWRRIRLVLWLYKTSSPDRQLPHKLRRELPGILRWAVNGALEWQRLGLAEPQRVTDATAAYRQESDVIGEFLKSCEVHAEARCTMLDLRAHYERWCQDLGMNPLGAHMFGKKMRHHGIDTVAMRTTDGGVHKGWKGVALPRRQ